MRRACRSNIETSRRKSYATVLEFVEPSSPAMKPPFKTAELDHLVLRCRDQAGMLAFYTDVIGLSEERRVDSIGLIQLRAGSGMLDLIPAAARHAGAARDLDHFCLGVEIADLRSAIDYLRGRGVEVVGEPATRYGARGLGLSIYIRDPEGNLVELKQIRPRATS